MISVIVPVYNEEKVIAMILHNISKVMKNSFKEYEIIVVNDGSTDRSAEIIEKERDGAVSLLTHAENLGYGKSLLDGIIASKYECIAIIDGDGSYSAEHIKLLHEHYPQYDMIVGARQGHEYRKGLFKKPARMLFQCLVEYASGRKVPDVNSGLRVFKKSIVMNFQDSLCTGFSFTTTLTLICLLNQYYVKYIPVEYFKRAGKSKVRHFKDTLRAGQIILEAVLFYSPIKLFLLIASLNLIFGAVLGALNHFLFKVEFLAITAGICAASFVPLFATGCIADQLRKIYNLNKRNKN